MRSNLLIGNIVACVVLAAALFVARLWNVLPLTDSVFTKILITLGVVTAVLTFLFVVEGVRAESKRERASEDDLIR